MSVVTMSGDISLLRTLQRFANAGESRLGFIFQRCQEFAVQSLSLKSLNRKGKKYDGFIVSCATFIRYWLSELEFSIDRWNVSSRAEIYSKPEFHLFVRIPFRSLRVPSAKEKNSNTIIRRNIHRSVYPNGRDGRRCMNLLPFSFFPSCEPLRFFVWA